MDPFGNGSCISGEDVKEKDIYGKKFHTTYSRQVRLRRLHYVKDDLHGFDHDTKC